MEMKECTCCGKEYPVESYHYSNKAKGIRKSVCKDCSYEKAKAHIEKDPIAHYHYMRRHYRENPQMYPGNYITKKMPAQCGVYKITCVLTDDAYIGCSTNIRGRIYKHKKANGRNTIKALSKLIKEYGWESMNVEILELCSKADMFALETTYIQKHKPNLNKNKKS